MSTGNNNSGTGNAIKDILAAEALDQEDNKEIEDREWDRRFTKFMVEDGPDPGPHSDPNHMWNTDREGYIELKSGTDP